MGQQQPPKILFQIHKQDDRIFLQQDDDAKSYLTDVTIYEPVNFYPPMDSLEFNKVKFTMNYVIQREDKLSQLTYLYTAHFAKDSINYKIFESHILVNWLERDTEDSFFKSMSFEARQPEECPFIGYSDNETLLAVKVWNYVKEYFNYK